MADPVENVVLLDEPIVELVSVGFQGPAGAQGPPGPSPAWAEELIVTLDGGGELLVPGDTKAFYTVTFNGTITGWYLTADQPGNLVLDVWKAANAIPTNANSIAGTEKPNLAAQQIASDTVLSTWSATVAPGDVLGFEIESATSITKATLVLRILKT
jgi:hypothetical protein